MFILGSCDVSTGDKLINIHMTAEAELLTKNGIVLMIDSICFIYILLVIFFIDNDQFEKENSPEKKKDDSQDLSDFDSSVTVLALQQPGLYDIYTVTVCFFIC